MTISVFTPSHNPKYLDECLDSLLDQSHEDWEWIVYLNGGAKWAPAVKDPRVVVLSGDESGIGALKSSAVSNCTGDILVELDHDDVLHEEALARVVQTFTNNPGAGLVYSHFATIDADGEFMLNKFAEGNGWTYRTGDYNGSEYEFVESMPATPHNVAYIWFAPNHLRAFTRAAYDAVGGYNSDLTVLDDQDLMARLYVFGEFIAIDECLYFQRIHDNNTQIDPEINAHIQTTTVEMYAENFESMALAWSARSGLMALDLGAAHGHASGYTGVDQHGSDITHTFPAKLALPDNSCGVIRASDFLEHVADKVAMANEIYRLLAPGGVLISNTPSTDGRGAFQDPTHVAFYNVNSFWYYTEPAYARYVPELECKFQVSRVANHFPSEWHAAHNIVYVSANLIAIKDGTPRNGGNNYWE